MRGCRPAALAFALLVAVSSATALESPDADTDALARLAAKGERAAIVKLLDLARNGDAEAQAQVGWIYYQGLVVQRNYPLAREWFDRAAAKDHAQAMNLLGHLYQEGLGIEQDYVQARRWYQQAAGK